MSVDEFSHWIAWARIRGVFGEQREDWRHARLCALLVNIAVGMASGKTGKAKASEYLPFKDEAEKEKKPDPETVQEAKQQIQMLQQIFGVAEG